MGEAKKLEELRHPNIIAQVDWEVQDNVLRIILEYGDGGDLHTYLNNQKEKCEKIP